MREIKFRVWDIENKIMIYPNHLNHKKFLLESDGDLCGLDLNTFTWLGVLSNKLFKKQLYTGLKDKNDKEIYEGDILKDDKGFVYEIVWGNDLLWLAKTKEIHCNCYCPKGISKRAEVIGNIYEDKHLLEVNHE